MHKSMRLKYEPSSEPIPSQSGRTTSDAFLSLTHTLSLSHTLSLTHSLSHTHSLALSHTHSLSLSHSLSHTHSLSPTHTHTHSLSLPPSLSLSDGGGIGGGRRDLHPVKVAALRRVPHPERLPHLQLRKRRQL